MPDKNVDQVEIMPSSEAIAAALEITPEEIAGLLKSGEQDFADKLEGMLDKLVPPDDLVIKDIHGKEYTLSGVLPARRQVKAFRIMREITESEQIAKHVATIKAGGGTMGFVDIIVAVATDEEILEKLGEAFSIAYPDVFGDKHPLDMLPIEGVVFALIPFTKRFLHKLGTGMHQMLKLM